MTCKRSTVSWMAIFLTRALHSGSGTGWKWCRQPKHYQGNPYLFMGGEDGGNHQETTFDPFDQPRINSFLSKPSPWAWCFLQTRTDNKSSRSIYLVLRSLSTGHLNPGLNQPPINRYARPMTQEHTNLHHPPIRDRRHFQTPLKNCDLEDRHPTEQPNLEE